MASNPSEPAAITQALPVETPEERKRREQREYMREWTSRPGNRERLRAYQLKRYHEKFNESPEFQEKLRKYARDRYTNPAKREAHRARQQKYSRTPASIERKRKWWATERAKEWARERARRLRRENPQVRLSGCVRARLNIALRQARAGKHASAVRDLCCSVEDLMLYLEERFLPGMTWENYGCGKEKWAIDHIRPLASFDLTDPEQQRAACHYTNLQPLWYGDNTRKGGKWPLNSVK